MKPDLTHGCAMLVAVAALTGSALAPARARDLSLRVQDTWMIASWDKVFVKPFDDATTIGAKVGVWSGDLDALKAATKANTEAWDLVQVSSEGLAAGCAGGLFEKLDWTQIGGKDHYLPMAVSDCGVGATVANTILAWDRDKFPGNPTWIDFWDVTRFPAKRGLRKTAKGNLEIALMADGVAPQDVYKTLATSDGMDRAFRKLDQLKPYIVWWQTPDEAAKILGSGDVLMTSAPSPAVLAQAVSTHRNFGMQWMGSLYDVVSWAVLKTSPEQREAGQFLYFSGTPAIQARLVPAIGLGGLAKGANDGLAPELAVLSPTYPANLQAGLRIDTAFWLANAAKLRQRFDAWLQH